MCEISSKRFATKILETAYNLIEINLLHIKPGFSF